jgi:hypothetical protein
MDEIDFTKTYIGEFWLPNKSEEKVPGLFSCKEDTFCLHLIKEFEKLPESPFMQEIILGFIPLIGEITLYKCTLKQQKGYPTNFKENENLKNIDRFNLETWYKPHYLFIGYHFKNSEEMKFNSISLTYSTLNEWLRRSPYKKENNCFPVSLKEPIHKEIKIEDDFNIILTIGNISGTFGISKMEIHFNSFFTLKTKSPLSLTEIIENCRILKEFLQFMTTKTPILTKISIKNPYKKYPPEIAIILRPLRKLDTKLDDIFIDYSDIEGEFDRVLQGWFLRRRSLKSTFIQFFSVEYNPELYVETIFLYYVQILEGYHRRRLKDKANLESRLKEILHKYELFTIELFQNKKERNEFVKNVVKNRDYMSHSLNMESISWDENFVTEARDILRFYIVLCILDEVGIPLEYGNKLIKQLKTKEHFTI